MIVFGKIRT